MPRFLSLVTALAAAGLSAGPTQTLSTPLTGARKLRCLPSGLILAAALSGLPKRILRGISFVSATALAASPSPAGRAGARPPAQAVAARARTAPPRPSQQAVRQGTVCIVHSPET